VPAPTRTRVGLAAVLVLIAPVVGACGAGRSAVTAHERAAIDGAQASVGDLQLRNVHLERPIGAEWAAGSEVPLALYVVNRGREADQLVSASAPGFATSVTLSPQPIAIGPGGLLRTGTAHTQGVTSSDSIVLSGLTKRLLAGQTVPVVLTFQRAGAVTIAVPVATS
jgi:copper(I)-binding protein